MKRISYYKENDMKKLKYIFIGLLVMIISGCTLLNFNIRDKKSSLVFHGMFLERPKLPEVKHIKIPEKLEQYIPNKGQVILVDYSMPSSKKRLWVLQDGIVVINCRVGHGKKSGRKYCTKFSNEFGSNMSSIGTFITGDEYINSVIGRAMRIHGLEPGVNDKVHQRGIRFHSSKYASDNFFKRNGYIGRSLGCFTTDIKYNNQIIDLCKIGTMIYVVS